MTRSEESDERRAVHAHTAVMALMLSHADDCDLTSLSVKDSQIMVAIECQHHLLQYNIFLVEFVRSAL
jgi:hypothetical protein